MTIGIDLGNTPVGSPPTIAEQAQMRSALGVVNNITQLDVSLADIATNTIAVTGPEWAVTTDDKPVFLPVGSVAPADNANFTAGAAWGDITGTLSSQTDLQSALDAKEVRTDVNGAFSAGDLGGNARGSNAINIQATREFVTQVASGENAIAIGNNSLASAELSSAFGNKAKATGKYSTASGYRSTASGYYSTASGYYSEASGFGAIALGARALASGDGSTASGYGSVASSSNTTALGKSATASGTYATAVGYEADASRRHSAAVGSFSSASGYYSTASGYEAGASGEASCAIGTYSEAAGNFSVAIGNSTTSSGNYSTALGNRVKTATDKTSEVGYWSAASVRAGAVRVHSTGMVAQTIQNRATAYADGGVTTGSEADNTVIREGIALRRNGNEILVDLNIGGTVTTLSLGTAS